MKIFDVPPNSEQWHFVRHGIPSASQAHRLITPKTRKRSEQLIDYARELAAERLLGRALDSFSSPAMTDGTEREAQAIASYELTHGIDTVPVGFITTDDGSAGATPDRRWEDGSILVEAKNPKAATHIGYLLGDGPDEKYTCQLQQQLYVCEANQVDIISCFPGLPDCVVRVDRDEEFIVKLIPLIAECNAEILRCMERFLELGYEPAAPEVKAAEPEGDFDLDDGDVQAIWNASRAVER